MPVMSASWKASEPMTVRRDVGRDGDDRRRVHHGGGEAGHQVDGAWAGRRHAHADVAAGAAVAVRHVRGALLVPHEHVVDRDTRGARRRAA